MTVEELVTKQQLEIEMYKNKAAMDEKKLSVIKGRFTSIGQPCNDNILKMNRDQLKWCFEVLELIEDL